MKAGDKLYCHNNYELPRFTVGKVYEIYSIYNSDKNFDFSFNIVNDENMYSYFGRCNYKKWLIPIRKKKLEKLNEN